MQSAEKRNESASQKYRAAKFRNKSRIHYMDAKGKYKRKENTTQECK